MQVDLSTLEAFTRLAAQYGPFLFAMLFIFVVTRTAHKYYQECNVRQQPPASEEERKTYRSYFRTSIWVGIALTALSVGWWIYVQMAGPSVYQIAIVGLRSDESILSQYFAKVVPRPTPPGADTLADDFFIIAQDKPFRIGDKFQFYYFKTPSTHAVSTPGVQPAAGIGVQGVPIEVKYAGNALDTYQLTQTGDTVSLHVVASNRAPVGNSVTAEEIRMLATQLASASPASSGH
jgi:hypothetical protein